MAHDPVSTLLKSAETALKESRCEDAQRLAGQAAAVARAQRPVSPLAVTKCLALLMRALGGLGRLEEGVRLSQVALHPVDGVEPCDLARAEVAFALGEMHVGAKKFDQAVQHLEAAGPLYERSIGPESPQVARNAYMLALSYKAVGRAQDAREAVTR